MNYWEEEINTEVRKQNKRWNGKVITTGRQWLYNDNGSSSVRECSMTKMWDAVREYQDNKEWN